MFHARVVSELARDWRDAMTVVSVGLRDGVEEGCEGGAAEARTNHRYKDRTGALTRSISGRLLQSTLGAAMGEIVAAAPHASFVEEPTAAHEIWPKEGYRFVGPLRPGQSRRAKTDIGTHRVALRWESGGQFHFARMVYHRGTQGYGFMGQAYLKAEAIAYRVIETAIVKAQVALAR